MTTDPGGPISGFEIVSDALAIIRLDGGEPRFQAVS